MNYKDLLNAKFNRTFTATIDGLGEVELTDLTSAEVVEILQETGKLDEANDPKGTQFFVAKWACRLLKGDMPPDKEIKAIQANVSASSLGQIYHAGLEAVGSKADHEKN